jgi:hypothetical protein
MAETFSTDNEEYGRSTINDNALFVIVTNSVRIHTNSVRIIGIKENISIKTDTNTITNISGITMKFVRRKYVE